MKVFGGKEKRCSGDGVTQKRDKAATKWHKNEMREVEVRLERKDEVTQRGKEKEYKKKTHEVTQRGREERDQDKVKKLSKIRRKREKTARMM